MKLHSSQFVSALGAALVALIAIGCRSEKSGHNQAHPPAPVVTVASIEPEEIMEWDEFTGRTAAIENVEVRPRVSGHIEAVKFQSGQQVKKGELLFKIDPRWYQAELDRRQAEYEQGKVRLGNAEREARRAAPLLATKAISTEEGEQREARFQESKAALLAAQAARDSARLDLEFTELRSPIDGRVSRALVTEGNYVSGVAGNATLLTTIVSENPIHVYADVDENTLLKFNARSRVNKPPGNGDEKLPAELQLADEAGFSHRGFIESFDNKLDPNTGSILLRMVFPNADGGIIPGLFARVRIPRGQKHPALLVDEQAIGTDQAQKFVLTLTETNTVAYRAVKLGSVVNGKRVVHEGLKAGEQVVVNGLARVRPGMTVQAQQAVANTTEVKVAKR